MKKKITLLVIALAILGPANACPVCERNQPKIFKGIAHGSGPDSRWDYLIIAVVAAIVLITLFLSVKSLLHPGEKSNNHIKRTVLNNW